MKIGLGAIALLAVMFLSLMLLVAVSPPKSDDTGTWLIPAINTKGKTSDISSEVVTGTDDIPIYPGAWQHSGGQKDGPYTGLYMFITTARMADVIAFYKQALAKTGWGVMQEGGLDNRFYMYLDWKNPANEVPLRRHVFIGFSTATTYAQTDISIDFSRWPDPNQVPLYPDAQHVEVKWGTDQEFGYTQRVITYETEANATDVEAYYKDILIQHGWWLTKPTPDPLIFAYRHSLPCVDAENTPEGRIVSNLRHCGTGSVVEMRAHTDENRKTKVELRVFGDEIDALHKQGQK